MPRLSAYARLLVALLALIGTTLAVQLGPWRYQPAPGTVAAVDDYLQNPRAWQLSRGVGIATEQGAPVARLEAGGRFAFLGRVVRPEPGAAYTRFSLEVKTEALQGRARDNRAAVVRATSFDQQRRRIRYWPHEMVEGVARDSDWTPVSLVVPWRPEVGLMRLEIANIGKGGVLKVRRIAIEPLVDAAWYPVAQGALIAGWVVLTGLAVMVVLGRLRPLRFGIPVAATGVSLIIAAVLPQPVFDYLANPFEQPLIAAVRASSQILPPRARPSEAGQPAASAPQPAPATPQPVEEAPVARPPSITEPPAAAPAASGMTGTEAMELARDGASRLRRLVEGNTLHAAGFGFLALLSIGFARLPFLRVVLAVAGVAVATEAVQLFTITRDADLNDIAVDATGALAGVLAGLLLRRLFAGIRNSGWRGPRRAG